ELDLLISDVVMPGTMNGVQLAACARGQRPDLRVLLLSGYVDENVTLPYPFLPKPFSQDVFRKMLEQVMSDSAQPMDAG
ncbi:MAG: hybrid sensor histidine kinase/response regulator, partial [Pseudomonadota bacterium]